MLAACALPSQQQQPDAGVDAARVFVPADHADGDWVPFVVLWGGDDLVAPLRVAGFAGVRVPPDVDGAGLSRVMAEMRRRFRIDQGSVHAIVAAAPDAAAAAVLAQRHEFQTVTATGAAADVATAQWQKLRFRRVAELAEADAAAVVAHLRALHDERRLDGAAAQVARALDSFHDAAAVADEDRYFAILPDDAVFLGTDATERWTGERFRAFALPYFERPSAWTYVPLQRHVTLSQDGALAWFDELLDNAHYGECRGSGVLQRRGDAWVLRQYNLTVPVPNELMGDVAQRIRAFADGEAPAVTTLLLAVARDVDGVERASAALADVPIAARYVGALEGVAAQALPAGGANVAVRALRRSHRGRNVLVIVTPDELPAMLAAAGVASPSGVDAAERVHVVTFGVGGARLLSLRVGEPGEAPR